MGPIAGALCIVSWNIHQRDDAWSVLADGAVDVALLQEARVPPAGVKASVFPSPADPWRTAGGRRSWRTAIAAFTDSHPVATLPTQPLGGPDPNALGVSREGTLTAVDLTFEGEVITLVSVYGAWEGPVGADKPIWADGSVHRLISDISPLLERKQARLIVAGDLNILHGYGERGSPYWGRRYATVFERMDALGVPFVGPQHPNGRMASPRPDELPASSLDVPTYHTQPQGPANAARQLDFVFASKELHERLTVRALNDVAEWGPSDHCRIEIHLRGTE